MTILSEKFRLELSNADKLVEEYLLFRGFMQAHRAFAAEQDRLHEFQVDKIVEELLRHLTSYNFDAMMDLWNFLDERYLFRLEYRCSAIVKHLELSLKRFYVVNALQCGQADKVRDIFERYGDSFHVANEWSAWFALPFLKDPSNDPAFKGYFTKEWASLLVVSIHNVLTSAFQQAPLPALLAVNQHINHIQRLELTIAEMEAKIRYLTTSSEKVVHPHDHREFPAGAKSGEHGQTQPSVSGTSSQGKNEAELGGGEKKPRHQADLLQSPSGSARVLCWSSYHILLLSDVSAPLARHPSCATSLQSILLTQVGTPQERSQDGRVRVRAVELQTSLPPTTRRGERTARWWW